MDGLIEQWGISTYGQQFIVPYSFTKNNINMSFSPTRSDSANIGFNQTPKPTSNTNFSIPGGNTNSMWKAEGY